MTLRWGWVVHIDRTAGLLRCATGCCRLSVAAKAVLFSMDRGTSGICHKHKKLVVHGNLLIDHVAAAFNDLNCQSKFSHAIWTQSD